MTSKSVKEFLLLIKVSIIQIIFKPIIFFSKILPKNIRNLINLRLISFSNLFFKKEEKKLKKLKNLKYDIKRYQEHYHKYGIELYFKITDSKTLFTQKNILDFGCGLGGKDIEILKYLPKKIIGIDTSKRNIKYANQLTTYKNKKNISFVNKNISQKIFTWFSNLCIRKIKNMKKINNIWIYILKKLKLDLNYLYDEKFATSELRNKTWVNDFYKIIINQFNPKSVIDFGCGTGDILKPFEIGKQKILGIDGSNSNFINRKISKKNFIVYDLRKIYLSSQYFDLCLCLEVAEHIEEKYANNLITSLCNSSKTIIFTAAIPSQSGVDHVNLKPKKWWLEKFKSQHYFLDTNATNKLRYNMERIKNIQPWYITNLQIFKKNEDNSK